MFRSDQIRSEHPVITVLKNDLPDAGALHRNILFFNVPRVIGDRPDGGEITIMGSGIDISDGAVVAGQITVVNPVLIAQETEIAVPVWLRLDLMYLRSIGKPAQHRCLPRIVIEKEVVEVAHGTCLHRFIKTDGITHPVG